MSKTTKNQSKKSRRISLLVVILVILLVGGGFAFHNFSKPSSTTPSSGIVKPSNTINYAPSTPSDNAANNQRKSTTTTTPTNTTLTSPSSTPSFSVTVSRAMGVGNNSITTAATVSGTTSGTCTFNFSQSQGGPVVISSQPETVQTSNQSAMCAPETVQMPSDGSWYVSVSVVYNGSTAVANWAANPVQL